MLERYVFWLLACRRSAKAAQFIESTAIRIGGQYPLYVSSKYVSEVGVYLNMLHTAFVFPICSILW